MGKNLGHGRQHRVNRPRASLQTLWPRSAADLESRKLMAMVRERARADSQVPFRLIYSVRSPAETYYAAEMRRRVRAVTVRISFSDGSERTLGRAELLQHDKQSKPDSVVEGDPVGWIGQR